MWKRRGHWEGERLCGGPTISGRATEDIKDRHKLMSEAVGLNMLYKLLPQMAVGPASTQEECDLFVRPVIHQKAHREIVIFDFS